MVVFSTLKKEKLGDIIIHYLIDEQKHIEWIIYPDEKSEKVVIPKNQTNTYSFVQSKIWKDSYDKNFSNGTTMFNSQTSRHITFLNQKRKVKNINDIEIVTCLSDEHGNLYKHHVLKRNTAERLEVWTSIINNSGKKEKLEYLPSFTLNGLSPFHKKQPIKNLDLIRLRSKWSMEGRIEQKAIEEYGLETSWKSSGLALEKIEQFGTMPVRKFFPILGAFDRSENVTWLVELDARASWQLSAGRIDD